MNITNFLRLILVCGLLMPTVSETFAQRRKLVKKASRAASAVKQKEIIFAVLNDGQTLEPIGIIDKGGLVANEEANTGLKTVAAFNSTYYKPNHAYNLIFGGASAGTVAIKSSNAKAECAANLAQVSAVSNKAKLKGLVMGLASNVKPSGGSSLRRMPTFPERAEIEALVRAEFAKQGVSAEAVRNMKYHNLTALDVDNDKQAEMVGTFWAENSDKERNLLFFIAEKDAAAGGKYKFGYSEYKKVTPNDVMSGELKDLEDGRGHELLLDAMEYDGDETAEIFTIVRSFEGNNFHVYSRQDGKWTRVFEGYSYHCAF